MDENWQFRRKLIKIYAVVIAVVFAVMLTVMTTYAYNKVVIIDGQEAFETLEEANLQEKEEKFGSKWKYDIYTSEGFDGEVIIPLSEDTEIDGIKTDIRYDKNIITVSFLAHSEEFFHNNPPFGDFETVGEAYGEFSEDTVNITFNMKETVVCESVLNGQIHGSELRLKFKPLRDCDKPKVLIDAAHGGISNGIQVGNLSEKEILLKIAEQIDQMSADRPYKIMLTRYSDSYLTTEERIQIANVIKPDLFIGLKLNSDVDNTRQFGMCAAYNAGFYRHGMQNVSFADMVLKNVCKSTLNKGLGLNNATEDDVILMTMDIPGTVLYAGYLSNPDEAGLLGSDEYIVKIAAGVINALDEIYIEE